jgi:predicted ATP-dependent endonuclease of OLD family
MKLDSIRIKNFKSIKDTDWCTISQTNNITILAGQNESGKSAILEALDFFGNGPSEKFERLHKRLGAEFVEVYCRFILGDIDTKSILTQFTQKEIQDFLRKKNKVIFFRKFKDGKATELDVDVSDLFIDFPAEILARPDGEMVDGHEQPLVKLADDRMKEIKEKIISDLRDLVPTISLYSSFGDLLPSEVPVTELKKYKAVEDFEKVFGVNLEQIANITDPRERMMKLDELQKVSTDDFNNSWNQVSFGSSMTTKYRFEIIVSDAQPKKIIFVVKGADDIPLYLEQKSMGFRWFSAFHIRLRALKRETQDYEYEKNDENFLVLIDEPGQNLHEVAQKDVRNIINDTATKGVQILYSTHNPHLMTNGEGKLDYSRIRVVSNNPIEGTSIRTITQSINDGGSMDALTPLRTALGLNSIESFIEGESLSVVVEGISDHYYLTAFRDLFKKNSRLFFLPACGVQNVVNVASLLIGWGKNYKAVIDDDAGQGRVAYRLFKKEFFENNDELTHQHVYKIKDCNGIEDIFSVNDFRRFVYKKNLSKEEMAKRNSEVITQGTKEFIAREFYDLVKSGSEIKLETETIERIQAVFVWLYEKFSISE